MIQIWPMGREQRGVPPGPPAAFRGRGILPLFLPGRCSVDMGGGKSSTGNGRATTRKEPGSRKPVDAFT